MKLIYTISIRFYAFFVRIASLWNPKAKKWMLGRKTVWNAIESWNRDDSPVYWFHCASLGEFEQGRPLMEKLKAKHECQLVITFFSPSGYEIRKNYELADLVIYLPRETSKNVNRFLDEIKPDIAFFIKYEFWANYIFTAKSRGVRVYSVSAIFRSNQLFFKSFGGYMRKVLRAFDAIFVQDEKSQKLLNSISVNSILTGDTRYDRVMENAKKVRSYSEIESFINGNKVLVIGSSWPEDEAILFDYFKRIGPDWKVIIAPHEIGENRLVAIENGVGLSHIRYSQINSNKDARCLIIDNIGMLMNVYQYATIAYVGGAFGKGLHNILEPACFGVPVIFGDNYQKFNEAFDFIDEKIGFSISKVSEFEEVFKMLETSSKKDNVLRFMNSKVGATDKILAKLNA